MARPKADQYQPADNAQNEQLREDHLADLGKMAAPKKKRYSDTMAAIHQIDRVLAKLTDKERQAVYLHIRNIFQPELSFFVSPPNN